MQGPGTDPRLCSINFGCGLNQRIALHKQPCWLDCQVNYHRGNLSGNTVRCQHVYICNQHSHEAPTLWWTCCKIGADRHSQEHICFIFILQSYMLIFLCLVQVNMQLADTVQWFVNTFASEVPTVRLRLATALHLDNSYTMFQVGRHTVEIKINCLTVKC